MVLSLSIAGIFLLGVAGGCFDVTVTSALQVRARDDVRGEIDAEVRVSEANECSLQPLAQLSAPLFHDQAPPVLA